MLRTLKDGEIRTPDNTDCPCTIIVGGVEVFGVSRIVRSGAMTKVTRYPRPLRFDDTGEAVEMITEEYLASSVKIEPVSDRSIETMVAQ